MFIPSALSVTFVERGRVRLNAPLTWTEAAGTITVSEGFVSNGASVPALFWPFVGHPYSGSLLRAAILHDWEIAVRDDDWRAVHRRFYRTLRFCGVGRVRAWLCFASVYLFAPRW